MIHIYNFFAKKPLWLVSLVFFGIIGLVWFSTFYWFIKANLTMSVQCGVCLGFVFSFIVTLMISQIRNSVQFWDYAKELENLIENTNTRQGLQNIVNNELMKLADLSMGTPHYEEIRRLRTHISVKSNYVN